MKQQVPAFLKSLYTMLMDSSVATLICWRDDGLSFEIKNADVFAAQLLPRYFKTNQFRSFCRQLNMYEFIKISEAGEWVYMHPNFRRDAQHLLAEIKRNQRPLPGEEGSNSGVSSSSELKALQTAVSSLQEDHALLREENRNLWAIMQSQQRTTSSLQESLEKLMAKMSIPTDPSPPSTSSLWVPPSLSAAMDVAGLDAPSVGDVFDTQARKRRREDDSPTTAPADSPPDELESWFATLDDSFGMTANDAVSPVAMETSKAGPSFTGSAQPAPEPPPDPLAKLHEPLHHLAEPLQQLRDMHEPLQQLQDQLHSSLQALPGLKASLPEYQQGATLFQEQASHVVQQRQSLHESLEQIQQPLHDIQHTLQQIAEPLHDLEKPFRQLQQPASAPQQQRFQFQQVPQSPQPFQSHQAQQPSQPPQPSQAHAPFQSSQFQAQQPRVSQQFQSQPAQPALPQHQCQQFGRQPLSTDPQHDPMLYQPPQHLQKLQFQRDLTQPQAFLRSSPSPSFQLQPASQDFAALQQLPQDLSVLSQRSPASDQVLNVVLTPTWEASRGQFRSPSPLALPAASTQAFQAGQPYQKTLQQLLASLAQPRNQLSGVIQRSQQITTASALAEVSQFSHTYIVITATMVQIVESVLRCIVPTITILVDGVAPALVAAQ